MPYRRSMPARKRPTREDTVTARKILLDGPAGDAGIFGLISELAPLHPARRPRASTGRQLILRVDRRPRAIPH